MNPSKVQGHMERTFGRPLTIVEAAAMKKAHALSTGKREAVRAMRVAIHGAVSDRLRDPDH